MALTPVEVRHVRLERAPFGYRRGTVDSLLEEIADSFEDAWRGRADLSDKVERLEEDLVRYRELETLLRTTLVSAERAAQELKEQAKREADLILGEAQAEARRMLREASAERERLHREAERVRAILRTALATIETDTSSEDEDDRTAEAAPEAA
jgi:cell division initiation protein